MSLWNHTMNNCVNISCCLRNSFLCNGTLQGALCTAPFILAKRVENTDGCQNGIEKEKEKRDKKKRKKKRKIKEKRNEKRKKNEEKEGSSYTCGTEFRMLKYFCFYHFREYATLKAQHTKV